MAHHSLRKSSIAILCQNILRFEIMADIVNNLAQVFLPIIYHENDSDILFSPLCLIGSLNMYRQLTMDEKRLKQINELLFNDHVDQSTKIKLDNYFKEIEKVFVKEPKSFIGNYEYYQICLPAPDGIVEKIPGYFDIIEYYLYLSKLDKSYSVEEYIDKFLKKGKTVKIPLSHFSEWSLFTCFLCKKFSGKRPPIEFDSDFFQRFSAYMKPLHISNQFLQKCFINSKLKQKYSEKIECNQYLKETTDFLDFPSPGLKKINNFIKEHTNYFDYEIIQNKINFILISILLFKKRWSYFDDEDGEDSVIHEYFYFYEKSVKTVEMMKSHHAYHFIGIQDHCSMTLKLTFDDEDFHFLLILPKDKKVESMNEVIQQFQKNGINWFMKDIQKIPSIVKIPKFTYTNQIDIRNIINSKFPNLFDDKILIDQLNRINVNENGVVAESITAFCEELDMWEEEEEDCLEFAANHPFIYFLMYKSSIIINGICHDPCYESRSCHDDSSESDYYFEK
ncbi:hypothetical protein TRFO_38438 [Tritrichomonas foetus]|uniref:Serpin domain-containing protein n=1 Tax=Tritrichomonas foetus TaxID=1144522 RepID=A0A1J4JE00_9EUKA|nr:hypothetical protein TRFO_38438 [Tritrichomonas foetus]|eukprot:OHS95484.1 hypothetical protein TRFO_38438 [Tritrichomonas foetus]